MKKPKQTGADLFGMTVGLPTPGIPDKNFVVFTEDAVEQIRTRIKLSPAGEAALAKAEAMERVDANADEQWKLTVDSVIRSCAYKFKEFTTDEVHAGLLATGIKTHEMRALGPAMARAAAHGVIDTVQQWKPSERKECHMRPVRIWLSRVYLG